MSTLFMVDNGFDINCGMKTSYRDVYEKYIREDSTTDATKQFKKTLQAILTCGVILKWPWEYAEQLVREVEFIESVRDFVAFMENIVII